MKVLSWRATDGMFILGFRFLGKLSFSNTSKPSTNSLTCKCCHTAALIALLFKMLYFILMGQKN